MITGEISVRYPNWKKVFRLNDGDKHPTAAQQYLKAAAIYARIFGKEDLEKKVPLYNNKGKNYTEYTKVTKNNGRKSKNSVTKEVSIRIQDHVLKYYDKYVMNK